MIVAGVEEAGRGPVIGPMVMCICATDEKNLDKLSEIGVKDSKLLSPLQRERLFEQIKKICNHKIVIISSQEIDDSLNDPEMNLNKLEAKTSAMLINSVKSDKVTLDCPSTNIPAYRQYVQNFVKVNTTIIAEHKADLNYVIVGAASILAKVTRDAEIEKIKQKHNVEFGSGYPSDPRTISFLKNNWKKYDFFRKTWATYKKVAENQNQRQLNDLN
ncbi:ribonuclease HII [Candidatus Woesearchaeota archaeon CG10_big_fil_rev_8_21_14_0_10_32_9]|nr:MAG: ribonuclease HII [Candidatus Woesearchaeota archaeon CG10_big_fil_rev_8_21_14_0_10_32_9]